MVDSIKPTFGTMSTKNNPYRSSQTAQGVESHSDEKQKKKPNWDRLERRHEGDRRRERNKKYSKFEMRRSPGRRRSDRPHPSIETKA